MKTCWLLGRKLCRSVWVNTRSRRRETHFKIKENLSRLYQTAEDTKQKLGDDNDGVDCYLRWSNFSSISLLFAIQLTVAGDFLHETSWHSKQGHLRPWGPQQIQTRPAGRWRWSMRTSAAAATCVGHISLDDDFGIIETLGIPWNKMAANSNAKSWWWQSFRGCDIYVFESNRRCCFQQSVGNNINNGNITAMVLLLLPSIECGGGVSNNIRFS